MTFEIEQESLQKEITALKKENNELKKFIEELKSKDQQQINYNFESKIVDIEKSIKKITESHEALKTSSNAYTSKIKDIENTIDNNKKILDDNINKGRDIERSLNELWEILENDENKQKWQHIPTQSQAIDSSDHQNENSAVQENKEGEISSFKLVIFGDSITKRIQVETIMKCDDDKICNLSKKGARVRDIYRQIEEFKAQHEQTKIENIVIHVGTNHIQRENPTDISRKICKVLKRVKFAFQDTKVYFSSIIPKYDSSFSNIIS